MLLETHDYFKMISIFIFGSFQVAYVIRLFSTAHAQTCVSCFSQLMYFLKSYTLTAEISLDQTRSLSLFASVVRVIGNLFLVAVVN